MSAHTCSISREEACLLSEFAKQVSKFCCLDMPCNFEGVLTVYLFEAPKNGASSRLS